MKGVLSAIGLTVLIAALAISNDDYSEQKQIELYEAETKAAAIAHIKENKQSQILLKEE